MINENELPQYWKVVRLEDVCHKITDGEHLRPKTLDNGVNFLSAKDITDNGVSFDNPLFISMEDALKFRQRCNPEKNDVLLVSRGNIGKSCIVKSDKLFCLLGSVILIKVKNCLEPKFLDYILKSLVFQEALKNLCGSTVLKAIYIRDIKKLPILLPPLAEQERIVAKIEELFSELDAGLESLKTAQAQLKTYRQAVLKYAFEEGKENYKSHILNDISEKIQIGPFGSQLHQEDYIENGIPLINPMHIKDGKIVPNYSYSIKIEKRDSLPNYIMQNGDVIMGRRGEMGRCGLVTEKENGWFCGTGSLYIRPIQKSVNSTFLYYYLRSETTKKYLEDNAGGTTMANLNSKIVKNIPVFLPTVEQQQLIVEEIESRLSVCDKLEETINASLKQAEALRQSILKQAFEGKLLKENISEKTAGVLP